MGSPDWKLIETFVRVAEKGSLTAAAAALGKSQPTASREIADLEEQIGIRLFVRHSRGLSLTDRGAELFTQARALDDGVQAMLRRASGLAEEPKGTVRVSVNEPIGVFVLPPFFAALRREHPDVAVEVVIDNAVSNLSRREADVAVRMFRPEQLDLVARKVGAVELGLFASCGYVRKHGAPASLKDAASHTLIGSDRDPAWARAIQAFGLTPAHFAFRTDSLVLQVQAVVDGVGVGGMQVGIAAQFPELVRVLPGFSFPPLETWVAMHEDLRGAPAVRVVFDALASFLAEYAKPAVAGRRRPTKRARA